MAKCSLVAEWTVVTDIKLKYITQGILIYKKSTSTRALAQGINYWAKIRQVGRQGRRLRLKDVPTLIAKIFAEATNRTN